MREGKHTPLVTPLHRKFCICRNVPYLTPSIPPSLSPLPPPSFPLSSPQHQFTRFLSGGVAGDAASHRSQPRLLSQSLPNRAPGGRLLLNRPWPGLFLTVPDNPSPSFATHRARFDLALWWRVFKYIHAPLRELQASKGWGSYG